MRDAGAGRGEMIAIPPCTNMTRAQIEAKLRLLRFVEDTDCWSPTLAEHQWALLEVLRLRGIIDATEAQIAIGLADLGMTVADFPAPDLHPADKIQKYLIPFAHDRLGDEARAAIDGAASDEYGVLAFIRAAQEG